MDSGSFQPSLATPGWIGLTATFSAIAIGALDHRRCPPPARVAHLAGPRACRAATQARLDGAGPHRRQVTTAALTLNPARNARPPGPDRRQIRNHQYRIGWPPIAAIHTNEAPPSSG